MAQFDNPKLAETFGWHKFSKSNFYIESEGKVKRYVVRVVLFNFQLNKEVNDLLAGLIGVKAIQLVNKKTSDDYTCFDIPAPRDVPENETHAWALKSALHLSEIHQWNAVSAPAME